MKDQTISDSNYFDFKDSIGNALQQHIVMEVRDFSGKTGKTITATVTLRAGHPEEKVVSKKGRLIVSRVYVQIPSTFRDDINPLELYSRRIVGDLFKKMRDDTARLADLKESLWERAKFVFDPK